MASVKIPRYEFKRSPLQSTAVDYGVDGHMILCNVILYHAIPYPLDSGRSRENHL